MKLIAMIPARLGSKRIPRKNIRFMGEKPLIQYALELALQCGRFDGVWMNSESDALGAFAESLGASFHKRPEELAGDKATNREFTYEFLSRHECDYVVMVNPTSPLLRLETLQKFCDFVSQNDFDTVMSTCVEKAEIFFDGKPLTFSLTEKINSQDLPPIEKIVWALTAWKRHSFLECQDRGANPVFAGKLGTFPIPKDESCDLDELEDWRNAEGLVYARNHTFPERYASF